MNKMENLLTAGLDLFQNTEAVNLELEAYL
jgi:hypothetical protein